MLVAVGGEYLLWGRDVTVRGGGRDIRKYEVSCYEMGQGGYVESKERGMGTRGM